MAHMVLCPYCKQKFDRDKEEYALIGARRYAHAACMLREAEKDPTYVKKEIIDPLDNVTCAYCKKPMSKKDEDCVMIGNGKYVHRACWRSTRQIHASRWSNWRRGRCWFP